MGVEDLHQFQRNSETFIKEEPIPSDLLSAIDTSRLPEGLTKTARQITVIPPNFLENPPSLLYSPERKPPSSTASVFEVVRQEQPIDLRGPVLGHVVVGSMIFPQTSFPVEIPPGNTMCLDGVSYYLGDDKIDTHPNTSSSQEASGKQVLVNLSQRCLMAVAYQTEEEALKVVPATVLRIDRETMGYSNPSFPGVRAGEDFLKITFTTVLPPHHFPKALSFLLFVLHDGNRGKEMKIYQIKIEPSAIRFLQKVYPTYVARAPRDTENKERAVVVKAQDPLAPSLLSLPSSKKGRE